MENGWGLRAEELQSSSRRSSSSSFHPDRGRKEAVHQILRSISGRRRDRRSSWMIPSGVFVLCSNNQRVMYSIVGKIAGRPFVHVYKSPIDQRSDLSVIFLDLPKLFLFVCHFRMLCSTSVNGQPILNHLSRDILKTQLLHCDDSFGRRDLSNGSQEPPPRPMLQSKAHKMDESTGRPGRRSSLRSHHLEGPLYVRTNANEPCDTFNCTIMPIYRE